MTKQTEQEKESCLKGKVCLIVDDDPAYCEIAAAAIRRQRGRPVVKQNGVEALQLLERRQCDLAIVDLMMPQIDGFRLISYIRHMPSAKHMPIAVATSRLDAAAKAEALRLGVNYFMTKPVDWLRFTDALCEILTEQSAATQDEAKPDTPEETK